MKIFFIFVFTSCALFADVHISVTFVVANNGGQAIYFVPFGEATPPYVCRDNTTIGPYNLTLYGDVVDQGDWGYEVYSPDISQDFGPIQTNGPIYDGMHVAFVYNPADGMYCSQDMTPNGWKAVEMMEYFMYGFGFMALINIFAWAVRMMRASTGNTQDV